MEFKFKDFYRKGQRIILAALTATGISILTITVCRLGYLQPADWTVLDILFRWRPIEAIDKRIVIVEVRETDIQELNEWPVSDLNLARALTKIKKQQPRVIGLDIYRDLPVGPNYNQLINLFKTKTPTLDDIEGGHKELTKLFKTTSNLIGVEKSIGSPDSPQVAPPAVLKALNQVGANDAVTDGDGVMRRGVLYPMPEGNEALPSLGLSIALKYLGRQEIFPEYAPDQSLKLGQAVFKRFQTNDGGYANADDGGYQILLNFRNPVQAFFRVSLSDVLKDRVEPGLMRDRIVLIGSQASSIKDIFYTPYSQGLTTTPVRMAGVEIQANLASQIISSVLDGRPLLAGLNEKWKYLIIFVLASTISIVGWRWRFNKGNKKFAINFLFKIALTLLILEAGLIGSSYLCFLFGVWIPIVAPSLALWSSALVISASVYINAILESKEELNLTNQQLNSVNDQLNLALEAACTGILDWNLIFNTLTVTKNCERLFGLKTDTFTGLFKDFIELIYIEDRERFTQKLEDTIKDRLESDIEFRTFRLASGKLNWLYAKYKVFYDNYGEAIRVLGTVTNITDLKQAADAYRREETKWRSLVQNSSDIISVLTCEFQIGYSTPSVQRILGYSVKNEDYTGQDYLTFIHPDDIRIVTGALEALVNGSKKIRIIEYRHIHRDGTWRFIESVVSNLLDDPAIEGIVLNSRDTTERKQVEARLKEFEIEGH